MTSTLILLLAVFLGGIATGVLLLVVLGIRRGDRAGHLVNKPSGHADAIARRVLGVGVRSAARDEEERS